MPVKRFINDEKARIYLLVVFLFFIEHTQLVQGTRISQLERLLEHLLSQTDILGSAVTRVGELPQFRKGLAETELSRFAR